MDAFTTFDNYPIDRETGGGGDPGAYCTIA
ncbi:fungal mating-type pheromone [Coprinopsis cinerea okayama7|uniref:Fungal mating-type pheromone n=1 Tax=Coprinopsis cinerea (strain Okayama-7 / 130 / ATCC MYA-4618 / FGSC 9003) TaxID=240176 RepID=D6RM41_COPC7|nr:fungal mating-type pheromone [Coprinopsis cinerea okayama7\|eukprot:XP_002911464.1 fungal mating-type pheromone [Coprinopsis cinerea okayama7\